jgi:hypothetical protein
MSSSNSRGIAFCILKTVNSEMKERGKRKRRRR